MEDKIYTWYINFGGDVQVYEGRINELAIVNVSSVEEAKNAHIEIVYDAKKVPKGFRGLFNPEKHYELEFIPRQTQARDIIKYFIPKEYAEAFFVCIDEKKGCLGESGITYTDVSKFLDD